MNKNRLKRALLGDAPRALLFLLTPTAIALALDLVLRGGTIIEYAPQGKAIYFSSWAVSAAFWTLQLWCAARLWTFATKTSPTRGRLLARAALAVFFGLWVLPLVTFSYGGQVLYHRVVHAYMGRDTVRLGFALRGTVGDWFSAWGTSLALGGMVASGLVITAGIVMMVRRAAPRLDAVRVTGRTTGRRWPPLVPFILFFGSIFTIWIDMVDSRFLQAALPDVCFVHGVVHAVSVGITGKGTTRRGVSLRTPAPLPPIPPLSQAEQPKNRPNVLVILTESVRADAICSESTPYCKARFLDEVASDRIGLGKLTTPSSGTFGACVLLWTGLPVNATVAAAHSAPVLWELARAAGYRTAYIASQNLLFENFAAFFQRAGIDEMKSAVDLGGLRQEQLGAPDERATAEMLRTVRKMPQGKPWFGVLHLSNTHAPYRVDKDLQPFEPHDPSPIGNVGALHNHYRNSVLLQERTVSTFLRALEAMPGWDDTIVLFLADHGEQFRERGGLYHLHSTYDEEVRVPGFMLSGPRALDDERRAMLKTYAGKRTYFADVHATIIDLFGLGAVRKDLPYANPQARSLVAKPGWAAQEEPTVLLSTATAVWDEDNPRYGVMRGERLLTGTPGAPGACFDMSRDPPQRNGQPPALCGRRMIEAIGEFSR